MFTPSVDRRIKHIILGTAGTVLTAAVVTYFGMHNRVTDVGYRPQQPVPFSHKLHVGELGIKCIYCHAGVERSAVSPIPTASSCMGCHTVVRAESPKLALVREAYETGKPIEWRRVHKLPDYVHFNHARHIRAGIDCASCHGPVERMGVVSQVAPLSMGWCLDCHRNPEKHIIPARPISGIFTGLPEQKQPVRKVKLAESRPVTNPPYGMWQTPVPAQVIPGVPTPKLPGRGPENCSACHY
ncbi:MAG: cytochrome c family protein [Candidatus Kapabacteria bacterium]|nr:cytochrome c family protein [Candidatus Kapabacteria bacterium]MDW8012365.1 cytochrome c3 family protein [Bacteroidota bacterium]